MRSYTMQTRKSHVLRFWLVTLLCAAMIGAACWFAYTQTARELTVQLETTVGSISESPATNPPYTKSTQMPVTTPPVRETVPPATTALQAAAAPVTAQPETAPLTEGSIPAETEAPLPLCRPVEGPVLQPFSGSALVKSPTTGVWQTHNGTDYAAALGDVVRAVDAGVVSLVEEDALWGVTVTIDHKNGMLSRYCNLGTALEVSVGDTVENGMVIGAVGNTADAESVGETHLHLEILKDGKYTDPEQILG